MSWDEPLVRGRTTNSKSSAASARSTVSKRADADLSMSEIVRCRTPAFAANCSWVRPSSRRRSRMEFPSCRGVRARGCMSFSFLPRFIGFLCAFPPKDALGAFSPESILGGFPPTCKIGGFPPKTFRYLWPQGPSCSQVHGSGLESVEQFSRGVAQPGSAPALGAGGPRFKSARPDQYPLWFHHRQEAVISEIPNLGPIGVQQSELPASSPPIGD